MPIVAAARAALRLATPERRARLWSNLDTFKLATGVQVQSPIVPLIIGSEQMALEASAELLRRGLFVSAIRPPTVPSGTSRLRVALSSEHRPEEIDRLASALRALSNRGVPLLSPQCHQSSET